MAKLGNSHHQKCISISTTNHHPWSHDHTTKKKLRHPFSFAPSSHRLQAISHSILTILSSTEQVVDALNLDLDTALGTWSADIEAWQQVGDVVPWVTIRNVSIPYTTTTIKR
jgi:hypothetical protein